MVACWTGNLDDQLILPTFKMPGHQYLPWTGREFRELVTTIKKSALNYGLNDFKVAIWFWGGPQLYDLEISQWKERHPETYPIYNLRYQSPLKGDKYIYATYRDGIPDGTPFIIFLLNKWLIFQKLLVLTDWKCETS